MVEIFTEKSSCVKTHKHVIHKEIEKRFFVYQVDISYHYSESFPNILKSKNSFFHFISHEYKATIVIRRKFLLFRWILFEYDMWSKYESFNDLLISRLIESIPNWLREYAMLLYEQEKPNTSNLHKSWLLEYNYCYSFFYGI